jgi:hypothetical protein
VKKILVFAAALMIAPSAFAKGAANKQTHHCEVDGKEVKATRKECHKQKGKWAKGEPSGAAAAAPAAAPK